MVAVESAILARIGDLDDPITYLIFVSLNLVDRGYMMIRSFFKIFMPFGNTKVALASQSFILDRNLETLHRLIGLTN